MNRRNFFKTAGAAALACCLPLPEFRTPYFRQVIKAYQKAMAGMATVIVVPSLTDDSLIYRYRKLTGNKEVDQRFLDTIAHADLRINFWDHRKEDPREVWKIHDPIHEQYPLRFNKLPDFHEPIINIPMLNGGYVARPNSGWISARYELRWANDGDAVVKLKPTEKGTIQRKIEIIKAPSLAYITR